MRYFRSPLLSLLLAFSLVLPAYATRDFRGPELSRHDQRIERGRTLSLGVHHERIDVDLDLHRVGIHAEHSG